jgi:hypothetical protein
VRHELSLQERQTVSAHRRTDGASARSFLVHRAAWHHGCLGLRAKDENAVHADPADKLLGDFQEALGRTEGAMFKRRSLPCERVSPLTTVSGQETDHRDRQ